jgi:hypothetical protein
MKNVAPMRDLYPSRRPSPSSITNSDLYSNTNSFSDTYSDPDTEAVTDIESGTGEYASLVSEEESDVGLDSEAEEILKDIAELRAEGPAKPNHTTHTVKLWKREGELWER